MRKVFAFLAAVILAVSVFAQSPQKMSYQAVVRNNSSVLITSTTVGMRVSILQGSPTGTLVYTETQTPVTNTNGLVSIEIGGGTGFDTINWANGTYFIKTETDPTGGTNYTITGISQLLTVPYALHAKTAESIIGGFTETDPIFTTSPSFGITNTNVTNWNSAFGWGNHATTGYLTSFTEADPIYAASVASGITGTDTTNWNNKQEQLTAGTGINITGNMISATGGGNSNDFFLGQDTLDGIVYYIYVGSDGQQHGLIVSKTESTASWSGSTLVGADRTEDGAYNMNLMLTGAGTARTWVEALGAGWYLPSIDELSLLWHNRYHVNKTARAIGSTLLSKTTTYWSSTEYTAASAYYFHFLYGYVGNYDKNLLPCVRAVRAF